MFLSCSSKLHLQLVTTAWSIVILHNCPIWVECLILFLLQLLSIYTHTLWRNVLLRLTIYILDSGPIWNTQTHRKSVHREKQRRGNKKLKDKNKVSEEETEAEEFLDILNIHVVHFMLFKKKLNPLPIPVLWQEYKLLQLLQICNLKSIYTYCILYI